MGTEISDWLELNADRALGRQRAQSDALKLVATFTVGIAVTLEAVFLELVGSKSGPGLTTPLAHVSIWAFVLSVAAALGVILLDRRREPDADFIVAQSASASWTEARLLEELRLHLLASAKNNEGVLSDMRIGLAIQVLFAVACGYATIVSILEVPS